MLVLKNHIVREVGFPCPVTYVKTNESPKVITKTIPHPGNNGKFKFRSYSVKKTWGLITYFQIKETNRHSCKED